MSISIVVPFYNEEECLKECFLQITETFRNSNYELIFVNDGSEDKSHQIIQELIKERLDIKYIFYPKNKGYSHAIRSGFEMAEKDFVSFLDADLQYPPEELFKMLNFAEENKYNFVMGAPIKKRKYYNPIRRVMSFIYNIYFFALFGIKLKDPNSLKLMRRKYLEKINFRYDFGMIEIETLVGFKAQKIPVNTFPINIQKRIAGRSKCSLKIIYRTIIDCFRLWISKDKIIKND